MSETTVKPPKVKLLESTKAFLDDLSDLQIINLSKRRFEMERLVPVMLTNKHGRTMGFTRMSDVQKYCKYLIKVGAVKSAVLENTD